MKYVKHGELISSILETFPDAVVWVDSASKIVQWNSAAERIFGFKRKDVVGRSLTQTIIPDEHRSAHMIGMANFMKTGTGQIFGHTVEIEAMTWSGEIIPIAISIDALMIDGEQFFTSHIRALGESRAIEYKTTPYDDFPEPVPETAPAEEPGQA